MAGENEQELVVKIDAPPQPDVVVKAEDPVKDLASQYKDLEAKNAEQTKAREEAERVAATARADAEKARQERDAARTSANASNLDTINTALAASEAAIEGAKRDLLAAKQAQDFEAELDAQDRLTKARIDHRTYDEAKATIEARAKQQPQPTRPTDPVEAYVANRTEPTANWLRAHRDFITDPRKNAKLTAAHHDAVAEGFSPDTTEYFNHVETFIGIKKEDPKDQQADTRQTQTKRATRTVAPVAGSGSSSAVNGGEVRLTAAEAERAVDGTHVWNYDDPSGQKKFKKGDPIGVQEFARRKRSMMASGQYDRSFETQ